MAKRSMGVMEMFVLVGEKELFMMKVKKIISLSGQGQTQISKRYRAQCSKGDVVTRTLVSRWRSTWTTWC